MWLSVISTVSAQCIARKIDVKLQGIISGTASRPPLTLEQVQQYSGSDFEFINPTGARFSCVDGRAADHVLSTLGGDFGELLAALEVHYALPGVAPPELYSLARLVQELLLALPPGRPFYYHTDTHAGPAFLRAVGVPAFVPPNGTVGEIEYTPEQVAAGIVLMPQLLRERALRLCTEPANIGCGFVRSVVNNATNAGYNISPRWLPAMLLKALHLALWSLRADQVPVLSIVAVNVLPGGHTERAVLNITTSQCGEPPCDNDDLGATELMPESCVDSQPAIRPLHMNESAFVLHPVAAYLGVRHYFAAYLERVRAADAIVPSDAAVRRVGGRAVEEGERMVWRQNPDDEEANETDTTSVKVYRDKATLRMEQWLPVILAQLAPGLPVYSVVVTPGEPEPPKVKMIGQLAVGEFIAVILGGFILVAALAFAFIAGAVCWCRSRREEDLARAPKAPSRLALPPPNPTLEAAMAGKIGGASVDVELARH